MILILPCGHLASPSPIYLLPFRIYHPDSLLAQAEVLSTCHRLVRSLLEKPSLVVPKHAYVHNNASPVAFGVLLCLINTSLHFVHA